MCFNYHFCQLHFDVKSNKNAKSSSIWKNFGPKKMKPDERIYTRLMKMLQSSLQVNRAVDVQYTIMTDTKQTTNWCTSNSVVLSLGSPEHKMLHRFCHLWFLNNTQ